MPIINFSVVSKEAAKAKINKITAKYEIIHRDVIGIIHINLAGSYYVVVNNKKYFIDAKCYSCKRKVNVYRQFTKSPNRILYIRTRDNLPEMDNFHWLPFAPGCIAQGNIVHSRFTHTDIFVIRKVYTEANNIKAKEAMQFYIDNYEQITKARKIKYKKND